MTVYGTWSTAKYKIKEHRMDNGNIKYIVSKREKLKWYSIELFQSFEKAEEFVQSRIRPLKSTYYDNRGNIV